VQYYIGLFCNLLYKELSMSDKDSQKSESLSPPTGSIRDIEDSRLAKIIKMAQTKDGRNTVSGVVPTSVANVANTSPTNGSGDGNGNNNYHTVPSGGGSGDGNLQSHLLKLVIVIFIFVAVMQLIRKIEIPSNNDSQKPVHQVTSNEMVSTSKVIVTKNVTTQGISTYSQASVVQSFPATKIDSCIHLTDLSEGKGYMLAKGECFSMGATPFQISLATESPITSITGSNFVIITNDESSSCDSSQVGDRCNSWMKEHQILGVEDSNSHKERYWYLVKSYGDIKIKSTL
jgi:hypothetical protein